MPNMMKTTFTPFSTEEFLAGDDGGLLRRWALAGFRRRLPHVVQAEGLEVGSVSRADAGRIESRIVAAMLKMIPYARIPGVDLRERDCYIEAEIGIN